MEITLDKRYEVSDVSAEPATKTSGKATAKPTGKATAVESTPSQEEKPDELDIDLLLEEIKRM